MHAALTHTPIFGVGQVSWTLSKPIKIELDGVYLLVDKSVLVMSTTTLPHCVLPSAITCPCPLTCPALLQSSAEMVRREVSTHLAALRAAEMAPNAPGAASAEGDSSGKEAEAGYVAKKIQQLIDNIKVDHAKPPPLAGIAHHSFSTPLGCPSLVPGVYQECACSI